MKGIKTAPFRDPAAGWGLPLPPGGGDEGERRVCRPGAGEARNAGGLCERCDRPDDKELYAKLGKLTDRKSEWKGNIRFVSSLLGHPSVKIRAKALWLLGEMGLAHPDEARGLAGAAAPFCGSPEPLLRERAANALGRIGRGSFSEAAPYLEGLYRLACDSEAKVRLSFIWALENIAVKSPGACEGRMQVFERLLHDPDAKVRMEAPEIFRVFAKRRPSLVLPYLEELRRLAREDADRVVRIHCLGAISAALRQGEDAPEADGE